MQPSPRSLLPRALSLLGRRRVQSLAWDRRVNPRTSCPVCFVRFVRLSSSPLFLGAGVPCVPGYHGENQDPDFLFEKAREIGKHIASVITSLRLNQYQASLYLSKLFMVVVVKVCEQ